MALPASGAISIGQYNRELLYRLIALNATNNSYLERNMNNSYFRYVNGATTAGSQISMSSGYGRSGLPRHIRLNGTPANHSLTTAGFVVDNSQNSIYAVGHINNRAITSSSSSSVAVIQKINTTAAGTNIVWNKYYTPGATPGTYGTGNLYSTYCQSIAISSDQSTLYVLVNEHFGSWVHLLVIRSSDGILLDHRELTITNLQPDQPDHIAIGPDGGIYITGSQYQGYGALGYEGMLWKLNSNLTTNVFLGFGGISDSKTQKLYQTAFNNTGTRMASVGYSQYPSTDANPLVIVSDLNGNGIWYRSITWPDGATRQGVFNSVTYDSAGNIYACGFRSVTSGYQQALIVKINGESAEVMWAKSLAVGGTTLSNDFTGITFNSAEGVLYVNGTSASSRGTLAIFDLDGNMLRLRTLDVYRASNNVRMSLFDDNTAYPSRGRVAFDSQGNSITAFPCAHTGATTAQIRHSTIFQRDKLYSLTPQPTNAGLRELVGQTNTDDAGSAYEYIPGYDGVIHFTEVLQSFPAWSTYYTYVLTDLVNGTNITSSGQTSSLYNVTTDGSYARNPVNQNSYPGSLNDYSHYAAGNYWG